MVHGPSPVSVVGQYMDVYKMNLQLDFQAVWRQKDLEKMAALSIP
jgi:hypothetical protein